MHDSIMERLWRTSHISGGNAPYVEGLFEDYLLDPNSVPEAWRDYFDKLPKIDGVVTDIPHRTKFFNFAAHFMVFKIECNSSDMYRKFVF